MPDLVTLAEVRAVLELRTANTERDALITALIPRASAAIENETQRELAATASATRRFRVNPSLRNSGGAVIVDLAPYDVRTVTTMTQNPENTDEDVVLTTSEYQLAPVDGFPAGSAVFTKVLVSNKVAWSSTTLRNFGVAYLDVLGAWGFATTPAVVKQACIETVRAWLERTPQLDTFEVEDGRTLNPALLRSFSIPTEARIKLGPYYRHAQVF